MFFYRKILLLIFILVPALIHAQEYLLPLQENPVIRARAKEESRIAYKPTLLTLPFFEDFTDYDPYPNPERWADRYVYINNTMGRDVLSRGVATFDALNEKGAVYYDTITAYTQIYADSLTSMPIDLSSKSPLDSVYLSFFYEPKGYGFFPKPTDSLMLYLLKSNGTWEKVWSADADTSQHSFLQVMVPVTDTGYFNSNFQMRWINKATKGISDSHWNLDYIRLDEGRNMNDTLVRDIAMTNDPPSLLSDFTSLPLRHYYAGGPGLFRGTDVISSRYKNNSPDVHIISINTSVKSLTPLQEPLFTFSGINNIPFLPHTSATHSYAANSIQPFHPADTNAKYVVQNTFAISSDHPDNPKTNDTIVGYQVFDNYFAYDDGTAEQSYFLNLLPSAPGATAVEFALYAPDTLRGIAIRFARTLPASDQKEFAIGVYQDIAVNGGTDNLVYQENYLYPTIEDTINKFSIYRFEQPVIMNTGSFFISIIQPAGGTSDSLQIALDANRTGSNHRYFKVENTWEPSLLDGALMLRPLVGKAIPLGINQVKTPEFQWSISPNPATGEVRIHIPELNNKTAQYHILDVQGRIMLQGNAKDNMKINVQALSPGMYFIRINSEAGYARPLKLLKL